MPKSDRLNERYSIPASGPEAPHTTQLLVRKSRFVTASCHCASADRAKDFIARVRQLHPDATHNCWAYVAGPPGDTARIGSSDAGEPKGTAGRPMLNALLHSAFGEICVVVSRWFGGIKLGTGGLVHAYQNAVLENLATLQRAQAKCMQEMLARLEYRHLARLRQALQELETEILAEDYDGLVQLRLQTPEDRLDDLKEAVAKLTNGSGRVEDIPVLN